MRGDGVDRRPLAAAAAAALVAVLLVSAAAPAPARASVVSSITGGISSAIGSVTGGGIAQLAVSAFQAIIKALFAPVAKFITDDLIAWLVAVPNLTQGRVHSLELTVAAMAGGLLLALATFSIIRFWLAGLVGSGGDAGLEGLIRTVAAAFAVGLWPTVFGKAIWLTNLGTSALMGSGTVVHNTSHLLAAGLGANLVGGPIGLFVGIAMAVAASLLLLGLLMLKIVLGISTTLVYVGMPLALVAWPVVPWVARLAMRAFAVCLVAPVLWALCFATASAVGLKAATFNASGLADTLLQPLVAIVLLYVMLRVPTHLARVAMLGAAPLGGGFVSRAVSYATGSQIRDTMRQNLSSWGSTREQQQDTESPTGTRLRDAATIAGAAASGGTAAGATAAAGATRAVPGATAAASTPTPATGAATTSAGTRSSASSSRAYTPPPSAQARAAGQPLRTGLQTPSFIGREQDFADEMFHAKYRERTDPVSVGDGRAALASLPENTRRGVGQLVSEHGSGARAHLAYQALGEWTPEVREALRTLAAATPEVRSQAISETEHDRSNISGQSKTADGPGAGDVRDAPASAPEEAPAASDSSPGNAAGIDVGAGDSSGDLGSVWLKEEEGQRSTREPSDSPPSRSAQPSPPPDRPAGGGGSGRGDAPPLGSREQPAVEPPRLPPPREPRDPNP